MAKLVFKGHATRGEELHKLLEHLGGVDAGYSTCSCVTCFYYINREGFIEGSNMIPNYMTHRVIMSLETFERKYPYKVGDKVRIPDYESEVIINKMKWDGFNIVYGFYTDEQEWCTSSDLIDWNGKPFEKEPMEKEISGAIVDRFLCLEGYDFYDDKGNIIDTKEITMKKKQPKYPKTFIECAKILDCFCAAHIDGYKHDLLENLQELIICRDAYWKFAGDWKPNFTNDENKFIIANYYSKVYPAVANNYNRVLIFPTQEMRDAFYDNFKELIEECKELL